MSKFAAFSAHIGISLVIFLVALYFIVFHWYPTPYFTADGGWQGIQITLFVDVVLGPLLTLIIYKKGKPGLRFDMGAIALVQSIALVWGIWTVYDQRTALVVFVDGAFVTMSPGQVEKAGLKIADVEKFSDDNPPMAFLHLPEDKSERQAFLMESVKTGTPLTRFGDRYEAMDEKNLNMVLSKGMSVELVTFYDPNFKTYLADLLKRNGGSAEDYAFIPIHCRYAHGLLVFQRETGQLLEMPGIQISPVV